MKRIARFEKVSQKRFVEDWLKAFPKEKEERFGGIFLPLLPILTSNFMKEKEQEEVP